MNTDNIANLSIVGYNTSTKVYKIRIDFKEDNGVKPESQKIYLNWNDIICSFKYVKKELNKDIYNKLIYSLCTSILIKDENYSTTKEFLFGKKYKLIKKPRKINDVQKVLNYLLIQKKDSQDTMAVDCIFKHVFEMIE